VKKYIDKFTKSSKEIIIGQLIIKLVTIVSIPILTRIFIPGEFGKLELLNTIMYLFSGLMIIGLDSALGYYYFNCEEGMKNKYIETAFSLRFFIAIIFLLLFFIFRKNISNSIGLDSNLLLFIIITAPLISFLQFYQDILRFRYENIKYIFLIGITGIIIVVSNIIFGYLDGLNGLIRFRFIFYLLFFIILLCIHFKYYRLKISIKISKKLIKYGFPLFPMTILLWLMGYLDRFLLNSMSGFDAVGLYGVGARFSRYIVFILSPVIIAWGPISMEIRKERNSNKFYQEFLLLFLVIGFFLVLLFTTFSEVIVKILVPKEYFSSYIVIGLLSAGYLFSNAFFISNVGINLSKKTIYTTIAAAVGVIINIIGNVLLIPRFNILGASFATTFSFLIMFLLSAIFSQNIYHINFINKKFITLFLLFIVFYLLVYNISFKNEIIELIINIILCVLFIILTILLKLLKIEKIKEYL
jgi:O-antigen/teichoic acid export membrane protein